MASRRPPNSTSTPSSNPLTSSTDAGTTPPAVKAKAPAKPKASRAKKDAEPTTKPLSLSAPIEISEDVRRGMIAMAAYLRAERRGFSGGHEREREDWLAAEAEVDALLRARHVSTAQ